MYWIHRKGSNIVGYSCTCRHCGGLGYVTGRTISGSNRIRKTNTKNCPTLEKAGVDIAHAGRGYAQNWIKDICANCEQKTCVFEEKDVQ